jgi:hypothetical protein
MCRNSLPSAPVRRTAVTVVAIVAIAAPLAVPVRADAIHVPADVPTIQGAIVLAADGDTIVVNQGPYFENIDVLGKDIVVTAGFAHRVDLHAAGRGSAVTIDQAESSAAVLQLFAIHGGSGQLDAGSGVVGGGYANLDNCRIVANTATGGRGDAIATQLGAVTMTACFIEDNGDALQDAQVFGSSVAASDCDMDFGPGTGADVQGDFSFSGCRFFGNAG